MKIIIIKSDKNNKNTKNNSKEIIRWKNRRRMAWISLLSILIVTAILLFIPISIERVKALSNTIEWFYFSMASIIGAYMGFTTWSSNNKNK